MAKKKSKRQLEEDAFEELRRKALEPLKPTLTKEDQLKHEAEIREKSMKNYHNLKEEVSETEKANIMSRANFEHCWD